MCYPGADCNRVCTNLNSLLMSGPSSRCEMRLGFSAPRSVFFRKASVRDDDWQRDCIHSEYDVCKGFQQVDRYKWMVGHVRDLSSPVTPFACAKAENSAGVKKKELILTPKADAFVKKCTIRSLCI
jgi:hypothetical protein